MISAGNFLIVNKKTFYITTSWNLESAVVWWVITRGQHAQHEYLIGSGQRYLLVKRGKFSVGFNFLAIDPNGFPIGPNNLLEALHLKVCYETEWVALLKGTQSFRQCDRETSVEIGQDETKRTNHKQNNHIPRRWKWSNGPPVDWRAACSGASSRSLPLASSKKNPSNPSFCHRSLPFPVRRSHVNWSNSLAKLRPGNPDSIEERQRFFFTYWTRPRTFEGWPIFL